MMKNSTILFYYNLNNHLNSYYSLDYKHVFGQVNMLAADTDSVDIVLAKY